MPKLADAMLTDQQIRRMPNPPIRVEKSDKNSGLYLIVQPSGAKSWAIRYRVERDGKLVQTRTTLGHYPGLGLADARTKARALRGLPRSPHWRPRVPRRLSLPLL